jgi:hypothetical protein
MLIIDDGLPDEDSPIHVMIKLTNGKLFDGEGIRTKQQVKEYYKYKLEGKLMFSKITMVQYQTITMKNLEVDCLPIAIKNIMGIF